MIISLYHQQIRGEHLSFWTETIKTEKTASQSSQSSARKIALQVLKDRAKKMDNEVHTAQTKIPLQVLKQRN